jgi:hypothetical protein
MLVRLTLFALILWTSETAAAREWVDNTGKYRVEADFVDLQGDTVRLKLATGRIISLPLSRLSEADRQFVDEQTTRPKPSPPKLSLKDAKAQIESRGGTHNGRFVEGLGDLDVTLVDLQDAKSNADPLAVLAPLAELSTLRLRSDDLSQQAVRHLNALPKLTKLEIDCKPGAAGQLAFLKDMPRLEYLELDARDGEYTNGVDDEILAGLAGVVQLKSLNLTKAKVTDAGFASLSRLTRLEALTLLSAEIEEPALARLADCKQLEFLNLGQTNADDATLASVSNFPKLKILHLDNTRVTDKGLAHLAGASELTTLSMSNTKVTGAGLAHLKDKQQLDYLFLEHTDVGDDGPAHLRGLPKLRTLILTRTKVSDACLADLETLPSLKALRLDGTNVTAEAAKALEAKRNFEVFDY